MMMIILEHRQRPVQPCPYILIIVTKLYSECQFQNFFLKIKIKAVLVNLFYLKINKLKTEF
jgi:hypothetical protein